jgi:hypothetical protein
MILIWFDRVWADKAFGKAFIAFAIGTQRLRPFAKDFTGELFLAL